MQLTRTHSINQPTVFCHEINIPFDAQPYTCILVTFVVINYQLMNTVERTHRTINLNVDKSWSKQKAAAVDNYISSNSLLVKHFFGIEDFAVSDPQIVDYYPMTAQQITVSEAENFVTDKLILYRHSLLLHARHQSSKKWPTDDATPATKW